MRICVICKKKIRWYERYYLEDKVLWFNEETYYFIEYIHRKCYKRSKNQDGDNATDLVYT